MKGLYLCLLVIVAVETVRSQGPPTRTKKGSRPSRRNDNPDIGLPSGADVPDGRRMNALRPAAAPVHARPAAPVARPAAKPAGRPAARPAVRPAARTAARPAARPAAGPAARPAVAARPAITTRTRSGPPPPTNRAGRRNDNPDIGLPSGRDFPDNRRVAPAFASPAITTRIRSGPPPPNRAGLRNDNPDIGLPSGRDWPDARRYNYFFAPLPAPAPYLPAPAPAPYQPAPYLPAHDCEQNCPPIFNPVCTIYGNEYDNDCIRRCKNEPLDCDNVCPCDSKGPDPRPTVPANPWAGPCSHCDSQEYNPVCVDNEENLPNECIAICEGKTITCSSTCPC